MSIFSKPAPFSRYGITELWPNGSMDHDDFTVTFRWAFSHVWPSVSCASMLSQCELASSVITQPPVTNSSCFFRSKLQMEYGTFVCEHISGHFLFHISDYEVGPFPMRRRMDI